MRRTTVYRHQRHRNAPVRSSSNKLLAALPDQERRSVLDRCVAVELLAGDDVHRPESPARHVFFPVGCLVSVQIHLRDAGMTEAGLIGREGVFGALPAGADGVPVRTRVQCAGGTFRIRRDDFAQALNVCPVLQSLVNEHRGNLMAQLLRSVACSCRQQLERRVARWLLTIQDRTGTASFRLPHDLLAETLGARSSGVRVAMQALQGRGMIAGRGAEVTVIDRLGLVTDSCECYDA